MLTIIFEDEKSFKVGATKSIGRDHGADSTNYRVESGADISDHIENAPLTLSYDCVYGDAPLNATGAGVLGAPGDHTDFDDYMVAAWENKQLISLDSEGRNYYENMQITSYSVSADNTSGYGLVFSLSVKEIRYADTKTGRNVPAVAKDRPTARRFAPPAKSGARTTTPASDNQTALGVAI